MQNFLCALACDIIGNVVRCQMVRYFAICGLEGNCYELLEA